MKPVSLLCPPSVAAERIYDTLCDGRESITVTTAAGAIFPLRHTAARGRNAPPC